MTERGTSRSGRTDPPGVRRWSLCVSRVGRPGVQDTPRTPCGPGTVSLVQRALKK